ncbi:MAG: energy transducer TonB, partial [Odoribacter sp.]|nr:energy transducer TonB [Odoribacter sp.]
MAKEKKFVPNFDDIVFEIRNKDYGAYRLRKKYNRNVMIGMLIGIIIIGTAVITPYLNAKALENRQKRAERQVELKMENLDQPQENVEPPPPPPPPPAEAVVQKYIAPVVVDSIKPEDVKQLMTADQAQLEVKNEDVQVQNEVQEEVKEEEAPVEVFVVVEEMPTFPGGDGELMKFINTNIVYPEIAKENGVQGRVILQFLVNTDGSVSDVKVVRGVDASLDKEAARVVASSPKWKPGRQRNKPVKVRYTFPVI